MGKKKTSSPASSRGKQKKGQCRLISKNSGRANEVQCPPSLRRSARIIMPAMESQNKRADNLEPDSPLVLNQMKMKREKALASRQAKKVQSVSEDPADLKQQQVQGRKDRVAKIRQRKQTKNKQNQGRTVEVGEEEKSDENSESEFSGQDYLLICKICEGVKVNCNELECGHGFCELCLIEYQVYGNECPVCEKPVLSRKISSNLTLDAEIEEFVSKAGDAEQRENFARRKKAVKEYKEARKIVDDSPSSFVDAKDDENRWKKAMIVRTFNRLIEGSRVKHLVIRYEGSEKRDEFMVSSSRLARPGFYTDRPNIPKIDSTETIVKSQIKQLYEGSIVSREDAQNYDSCAVASPKEESKLSD